jgi:hypothetical protein
MLKRTGKRTWSPERVVRATGSVERHVMLLPGLRRPRGWRWWWWCNCWFHLGVDFLGVEVKGLPGVLGTLLHHGTKGGHEGVFDKCKWCGWVKVCQQTGAWQTSLGLFEGPEEFRCPGVGMRALDSGAGQNVVSGAWCATQGAEIACRISACTEKGRADWRSWEGGSPVDKLFVLPAVGKMRRRLCNWGRWSRVLGRSLSPGWWGFRTTEVGQRETVDVVRVPRETGIKRECRPSRRWCLQSTRRSKWERKSMPMRCVTSATTNHHVKSRRSPRLRLRGRYP